MCSQQKGILHALRMKKNRLTDGLEKDREALDLRTSRVFSRRNVVAPLRLANIHN